MPDIPEVGGYCSFCGAYIEGKGPLPAGEGSADKSCPWEEMNKLGFFRSLIDTITGVLFQPADFFGRLPLTAGIGKPIIFALLVGSVGNIISLLWQSSQTLIPQWLSNYPGFEDVPFETFWPYWMSGPAFMVVMILLTPLLILIGLFISSAILHLCLLLLGGADGGFEATFRVVSYATATSAFQILPFCGGIISLVWSIVVTIIGLREVHEISGGKAAAAYFLPLLFCCGFLFILAAILGFSGFGDFSPVVFR